ncbi:MAG TPA: hypothetical protein VGX68_29205 [Thermoanaerobaculia bacterium]|jgi:hypothetical protein|nr:hypothetical protein [Thermoanaerobaculia bacterium]
MIGPETPFLALIAGILLLIAGRRLFWLFVGLVGFFTVYRWLAPVPAGPSPSGRWLVAILAGLLGIVLAIFLQRLAVAVAGFFVGGWFVAGMLGAHLASARGGELLLVIIGAVIAAVLAIWLFDLALVILSSIAGADLIVEALHPRPGPGKLLIVVLAVVGIAVQLGFTARRRERG